jgi:hypothetical protein
MDEQLFRNDSAIWKRGYIAVFIIYSSVYGLLQNLYCLPFRHIILMSTGL